MIAAASKVNVDQIRFILGRLATSPAEVNRMAGLLERWRDHTDPVSQRVLALAEACSTCGAALSREEMRGEIEAIVAGTDVAVEDLLGPCRSRIAAAAAIEADATQGIEDFAAAADRAMRDWRGETTGETGFKLDRRIFSDPVADFIEGSWSASKSITAGTFGIISGAPSMGKSTFGIGAALSAINAGVRVHFYQADIDRGRFVRDLTNIAIGLDRNAGWAEGHERAVRACVERIRAMIALPRVGGDALVHPTTLFREIRSWQRTLPPGAKGLVVVDYLQRFDDGLGTDEHIIANTIARRLADLSTSTGLTILGLSQQTKGSQIGFAKAVADAAKSNDSFTYGERLLAAIDAVGAHAAAGGDIRKHPSVLIALAGIAGRTVMTVGKTRSHAWGSAFRDHRALLADLSDNGRWNASCDAGGRPLSIEAFAAGVLAERRARRTAERAGKASAAAAAPPFVMPTAVSAASTVDAGEPNQPPRRRQRGRIILDETGDAP